VWRHYRGKHVHPEGLLTLGYGDGGGGTSAEMLERRRAAEDLPVLPRTRWGRVDDYFADLRASAETPTCRCGWARSTSSCTAAR
jgi:alpha-mannosidase